MRWSFDRTGFPVLELPESGLMTHLWPVAKTQLERFLAEPNGPGDAWYETLLAISPRTSIKNADERNYESVFAGGLLPDEAIRFAQWLGDGFDVPTFDQWRAADAELLAAELEAEQVLALRNDAALHPQARLLLDWCARRQPETWGQLGLRREAMLEWVRIGDGQFGGLGSTRPQFLAAIVNPQRDAPVIPVRPEERKPYFGVRLMRSSH